MKIKRRFIKLLLNKLAVALGVFLMTATSGLANICEGSSISDVSYSEVRTIVCRELWEILQKRVTDPFANGGSNSLEDSPGGQRALVLLGLLNSVDAGVDVSAEDIANSISGQDAEFPRQAMRAGLINFAFDKDDISKWCVEPDPRPGGRRSAIFMTVEKAVRCGR